MSRPTTTRTRLDADWLDTCRRHDPLALEWARSCPALDGCTRLDDVVATCRRDDVAMLAVLTRAQSGCPVAGRSLLRALLPHLAGLARRDPQRGLDDYLGACWPVAMGYHPEPGAHVLSTLALNTRKAMVRERGALWLVPVPVPDAAAPTPEPEVTVRDVMAVSRRLRLVPTASADVLTSVYGDGLSGREAAQRHGMSPDMVRYRCSSAVRVLRAHRHEILDNLPA